jgi:hypothetical protein
VLKNKVTVFHKSLLDPLDKRDSLNVGRIDKDVLWISGARNFDFVAVVVHDNSNHQ